VKHELGKVDVKTIELIEARMQYVLKHTPEKDCAKKRKELLDFHSEVINVIRWQYGLEIKDDEYSSHPRVLSEPDGWIDKE